MFRLGGALGISACCIGLVIFILGCAGFSAAFTFFPMLVLGLGAVGLICSLIGVNQHSGTPLEDTRVLAALFVSSMGLLGGLLEMAIWLNWPLLGK